MSSPSTPCTSIKAATLYSSRPKIREKSSSFPSRSTLNLFHKKPRPHHPFSPFEPCEVAPGLWSTDATVFGHLGTNNKRFKPRVKSAGPEAPRQEIRRKPVHIRGSLERCKKARFIDRTEHSTYESRDRSEAAIQFRQKEKDEQKTKRESDWPGTRREKMRTVSRDDQLIVRGANPRTGLVSPFIVSDNSEECLGGGYITMDKFESAGPLPGKKTRSGKWKQDSLGWSLVESPPLSPIAQSMSDKMSRTVSIKQLEDRSLVQMPDVDDPNPKVMTDEQIKKYQENITRAYKRGGGSITMLDPDTLLSPREWTPERPSTPTTKLHKIPRKEVGSGVVRKNNSADTVIVNANNHASSPATPRKDIKWQKDRIITPSNTPKGSSFESCANISHATKTTKPFLGRGSGTACSPTTSAIQSQSYLNAGRAHQSHQNESESSPFPTRSNPPPAFRTLSQYLPRLQFLHPSHFASLETSFYRRPMLRSAGQKGRTVEDACTTTITTTSRKRPAWEQRPKMQRHGNEVMPRLIHLSPSYGKLLDGHHQEVLPRIKQSCSSNTLVDTLHTSGFTTGRSRAFGAIEKADPTRDLTRTRFQETIQMPAAFPRQAPCENRLRDLASTTHMTQGLSLGSANVTRERIRRNLSGDGCTPTYGPLGNESRAVPGGRVHYISDDKEQAILPADLTISSDSNAWFAGRRVEVKEQSERPDLTALTKEEILARRLPVSNKATDVKWWLYAAEAWVESLATLGLIQRPVHRIICHIIRTLHHASLALITSRMANATPRERIRAIKDLTLATFYMLVTLRILGAISKVLYWVWCHPTQAILTIIRWCVVG